MKTYLTYGFALALGGGLLTLALFFLGYHSEAEKISAGQAIGVIGVIAITVAAVVLGTKARRADLPAGEPFGYGRALGVGVMIVLFGSLFGVLITFVYLQHINPDMVDVLVQTQIAKLETQGVGSAQIEQMENGMRMMMKPPIMAVFGFVQSLFTGTVIALITSAFLRRPSS